MWGGGKDLSLLLGQLYHGNVRDSEASPAHLDPLLGICPDSPLVAMEAKVVNEIPLNDAMRLLSEIPLHNLAVDIFPIRVIARVEVLFHRYQSGSSSHSFRLLDSGSQTPISPAPALPPCCVSSPPTAHPRPFPASARNPDLARIRL